MTIKTDVTQKPTARQAAGLSFSSLLLPSMVDPLAVLGNFYFGERNG